MSNPLFRKLSNGAWFAAVACLALAVVAVPSTAARADWEECLEACGYDPGIGSSDRATWMTCMNENGCSTVMAACSTCYNGCEGVNRFDCPFTNDGCNGAPNCGHCKCKKDNNNDPKKCVCN